MSDSVYERLQEFQIVSTISKAHISMLLLFMQLQCQNKILAVNLLWTIDRVTRYSRN